jgi:hypothetical protein
MPPPLPRDENALLAFDGAYLAGLSRFGWTDGGEQLLVMTVARDVRYKGMGVGLPISNGRSHSFATLVTRRAVVVERSPG